MTSSTNSETASSRRPLDIGSILVQGWLGERIERAMVAVDNLRGTLFWHGSGWGYEHAARWLRNEVLYGRYSGRFHPAIGEVIQTMLGLVEDGRAFRDYSKHALAAANEEEFLMGLLAYYRQFGDAHVLEIAKRFGRSLAENHPRLAGNHYYKSLAIGRLLDLADATGDSTFRAAAIDIAEDQKTAGYERPGGGDGGWSAHGSHGAAVCMIMAWHIELYKVTGNRKYRDWACSAWEKVRERVFMTGGMGEHMMMLAPADEGADLHDETCQHAWWLIANLGFWRVMGEGRYLDMVERILYNHLLFAQLHRGEDGGFCGLGNIDQGFRGQHNYICCDNEGLFCLFEVARHIVTTDVQRREVTVNFPIPSEAMVDLAESETIRLKIDSDYPVQGRATVVVNAAKATSFALRVRIPGGVAPASVRINDAPTNARFEADHVVIERTWQPGDRLGVVFHMPMRVEADNTGFGAVSAKITIDGREYAAKRFGVFHGPVLAIMFRTGHGNDINWVWTGDYPEALDSGGCVFEKYPASKLDYLGAGDEVLHNGRAADRTEISTAGGIARIRWSHQFGDRVEMEHEVTVHPGLPVTLDWRETVRGWNGTDKLLCGGVRFGVAKRSRSLLYGHCAFPYPFPAITTTDNLDPGNGFIAGGGSFSLAETLTDGGEIKKTGTYRLSNGHFRVICHYGADQVQRVTWRAAPEWAGVYFEPAPGNSVVLSKRLVFPLYERPLNQDLTRLERERVREVRAELTPAGDGRLTLKLAGPVIQHTPILLPKSLNLQSGWLAHNEHIAARIVADDAGRFVLRVPVPGSYLIEAPSGKKRQGERA